MGTAYHGTFVISWSQTELDGLRAADVAALRVGATWSWSGDATRIDGPAGVLCLGGAIGEAKLKKRAGQRIARLVGDELERPVSGEVRDDDSLFDAQFTVTDGRAVWAITVIEGTSGRRPLLAFTGDAPPRNIDLWIVRHTVAVPDRSASRGTICFTPGTMILTEHGPRPVESLKKGDRVQTKDSGCEEILWLGHRRITGARLRAMPHLAPVRLTPGALGEDIPEGSLLVSPDHRIVVRGARAEALWSTPEVLIAARDLVDHDRIFTDFSCRELTYIHLMLPAHQVVFANGVETESFHPALARTDALGDADRAEISACIPDVLDDASLYGGYARRLVSTPEAAIMRA